MRILVFLMVFVPWFLQAQTLLKAGSYRYMKPDKTIVLDSGVFTFISLEFISVQVQFLTKGQLLKVQKMVLLH